MKKYIIELPENTHWIQWIMEGTKDHHPYMNFKDVEDLTPYTELDLEKVKKEAYEKGRKDVETQFCSYDACKNRQEEYQRGLADAWEAAKKIQDTGGNLTWWIHNTSAPEAIEKIRQYEQEQKELKVGDEVITDFGKAAVIGVGPVHFEYFYADGSGDDEIKNAKKTGRHFPEIAEVLRKMKETE